MLRFYAPFITEATPQVTMALRSERAMVRLRQKYRGVPNLLIIYLIIIPLGEFQMLCQRANAPTPAKQR